jgi:hypothetical protein
MQLAVNLAQCHLVFPILGNLRLKVGRTPRSAADPLVGWPGLDQVDCAGEERVQADPRGHINNEAGGPPHHSREIRAFGKTI